MKKLIGGIIIVVIVAGGSYIYSTFFNNSSTKEVITIVRELAKQNQPSTLSSKSFLWATGTLGEKGTGHQTTLAGYGFTSDTKPNLEYLTKLGFKVNDDNSIDVPLVMKTAYEKGAIVCLYSQLLDEKQNATVHEVACADKTILQN